MTAATPAASAPNRTDRFTAAMKAAVGIRRAREWVEVDRGDRFIGLTNDGAWGRPPLTDRFADKLIVAVGQYLAAGIRQHHPLPADLC